MDDEYIETNCRSHVFTLYIHRLYIGGSRSFSNKQGIHVFECYYFSNGYFYELANLYVFKYQTQKFIDISMCTQKLGDILCMFSVCLVRNAVCTLVHVCTANLCRYEHTCMDPDVLFTVFKIMFYEILTMLTKTYF